MPHPLPLSDARPWSRLFLASGALLGLLTVAMGALASHLPDRLLVQPDGRALLRVAVETQGWHIAALLACGLLAEPRPGRPAPDLILRLAGIAFLLGLACFSGALLVLAISGRGPTARLAPFGGVTLMAGWLLLLVSVLRGSRRV